MTSTDPFRLFGEKLACRIYGVPADDLPAVKGFVSYVQEQPDGAFHKMAASAAALTFAAAGMQDSIGHQNSVELAECLRDVVERLKVDDRVVRPDAVEGAVFSRAVHVERDQVAAVRAARD